MNSGGHIGAFGLELALAQDPQVVVRRSLDLARAIQTVGNEAAQGIVSNNVSTPVLLRRLCEELGATYVSPAAPARHAR